jgi:hypothetical protein
MAGLVHKGMKRCRHDAVRRSYQHSNGLAQAARPIAGEGFPP